MNSEMTILTMGGTLSAAAVLGAEIICQASRNRIDAKGFWDMILLSKNRMTVFAPMFKFAQAKVVSRERAVRRMLALGVMWLGLALSASANTGQVKPVTIPVPALDAKHVWALGMIETGNNDREIGGAGEVSRFQILPRVWKGYTTSESYHDPEVSLQVARQHWTFLATSFAEKTGRPPSDFDMYVLWNTGVGYYSKKGFDPKRVCATVKDRAERFVNLVNRRD